MAKHLNAYKTEKHLQVSQSSPEYLTDIFRKIFMLKPKITSLDLRIYREGNKETLRECPHKQRRM